MKNPFLILLFAITLFACTQNHELSGTYYLKNTKSSPYEVIKLQPGDIILEFREGNKVKYTLDPFKSDLFKEEKILEYEKQDDLIYVKDKSVFCLRIINNTTLQTEDGGMTFSRINPRR